MSVFFYEWKRNWAIFSCTNMCFHQFTYIRKYIHKLKWHWTSPSKEDKSDPTTQSESRISHHPDRPENGIRSNLFCFVWETSKEKKNIFALSNPLYSHFAKQNYLVSLSLVNCLSTFFLKQYFISKLHWTKQIVVIESLSSWWYYVVRFLLDELWSWFEYCSSSFWKKLQTHVDVILIQNQSLIGHPNTIHCHQLHWRVGLESK